MLAAHLVKTDISAALLLGGCILIHITDEIHMYYCGQLNLSLLCNPTGNRDLERNDVARGFDDSSATNSMHKYQLVLTSQQPINYL